MQTELLGKDTAFSFMKGNGEMSGLIRNYDWSQTSIGSPQQWPQSLKTTLGIILNSKFPMFLFWGPDLICFYNDAYRPSLGNDGKHPGALGKKAEEVWPEIWHSIGLQIEQVLQTGESTWNENHFLPIYRNSKLEDVYWTYSYSPVYDETGKPAGVFVTCMETTDQLANIRNIEEAKQQHAFAIEAAELATWDYDPVTNQFTADDRYTEWFGLTAEQATDNELSLQVIAEEDRERVMQELRRSIDPASGGRFDIEYTIRPENKPERVMRAKGKAWFDERGKAYRLTGTLQDVTEHVRHRDRTDKSEQELRAVIESAPFPIGIYVGREMRIQFANQTIKDIWGKGNDIVGKTYHEVLPELENQQIYQQLDNVYTTGVPFEARHQRVDLVVGGELQPFYFNYNFTPLFDANGKIYGVMNTAAEVTDLVTTQLRLKESEKNLRNIILQAPVAMAILKGREYVVEIANEKMYGLWGKDKEVLLRRPIFEALPELRNQGFEELLNNVFTTGETYTAYGVPVMVPRGNKLEQIYINFVYEAFRDGDGTITGIMAVATDVTEQVLSTKKIEETETRARLAIESAELGTYVVDLKTNELIASPRMAAIFNVEEDADRERFLTSIHPDDIKIREEAHNRMAKTGVLDYDARVIWKDGSIHWFRAKGRVFYNKENKPESLIGVVQDITELKEFEHELTRQVKERTAELETLNIELQRSNANLEEFAHAASHDLKEPIRKIHFFTSRLRDQLGNRLNEDEKFTFGRIENASQRMTSLIDDLLLFSQVSQKPIEKEEVNLNEKISRVLEDIELEIQQKSARITVGPLPVVFGYRRQLQQLFQNLLTNAIKYNKPGLAPEVTITAEIVKGQESSITGLALDPEKQYHLIKVADNGIGFEPEEADRIFQMFTRLHGNREYRGTGVGLSIARKVVENHNGRIVAEGRPGEGATFKVYLPVN